MYFQKERGKEADGRRRLDFVRREVSGALTVEAVYLAPMIFMLVILIIQISFYYHDKNILLGAAEEVLIVGVQSDRRPEGADKTDLTACYQERAGGKLLLFSKPAVSITRTEEKLEISVSAKCGKHRVQVLQKAFLIKPEKKARRRKNLQDMTGQEE